jgi:hypothetical protein
MKPNKGLIDQLYQNRTKVLYMMRMIRIIYFYKYLLNKVYI